MQMPNRIIAVQASVARAVDSSNAVDYTIHLKKSKVIDINKVMHSQFVFLKSMHKYFIKTPWFVKKIFPSYVWDLSAADGSIYLSFDDGPHPEITSWVLDELKKYDAKATFFCIGKNAEQHPKIYQRILDEGHATGNHSYSHVNGWKTTDEKYIDDVTAAATYIQSNLFRPPYGRIKSTQAKMLVAKKELKLKNIIMWDVLSADFDQSFTPQQCLSNVIRNTSAGSIIVFHDSEKAFHNLQFALTGTLEFAREMNYRCKKIELK
jgi:peptidoglycan/xylan/chitin deacetylase (PgdA/CDA1 family)